MKYYGKELILDIHECDSERFNRDNIDAFFFTLCQAIDMIQCERFWWDDVDVPEEEKQTSPHTKGTTAIQFILTSNITIHTLDELKKVFLNVFSCKEFKNEIVEFWALNYFGGKIITNQEVMRK